MSTPIIDRTEIEKELVFQTSRSGGSGGQNVNKVETKVEVRFDIVNSAVLTEAQKAILLTKLKNRTTNEGILVLSDQTSRSQLTNKDHVVEKLHLLMTQALIPQKARRPSKPTFASKLKRLKSKQKKSLVKSMRRKPFED